MSRKPSKPTKRKAENVFDVEEQRVKKQKNLVKKASSDVAKKIESLGTTLASVRELVSESSTRSSSDNKAEKEHYEECSSKLLELERAASQLRLSFTNSKLEYLRNAAANTFQLSQYPISMQPAILIADCPWTYTNPTHHIGTSKQYNTMSDEALCAMPVAGLVNDDCALLMWATFPKLDAALKVMRAWGFTYRTVFLVWIKTQRTLSRFAANHGKFLSSNAELILVGERGSLRTNEREFVHQCNVLFTPLRKHSQKPDILKSIAVELFGDLPRWSLFERIGSDFERFQLQDWILWGDQVVKPDTPTRTKHDDDNDSDDDDNVNADNSDDSTDNAILVESTPESSHHTAKNLKQRSRNISQSAFTVAKQKARATNSKTKGYRKLRSEITRVGYQTAHNSATKSDFVLFGDGSTVLERDQKHTEYRAYLAKGDAAIGTNKTLESCIAKSDLTNNKRIDDYTDEKQRLADYRRAHHAIYTDLTNDEVRENIAKIREIQKRNADVLFARNYNSRNQYDVKYDDDDQDTE